MGSEASRTESVAEAGGAETGWELIVDESRKKEKANPGMIG
jgi:hypothetical protein